MGEILKRNSERSPRVASQDGSPINKIAKPHPGEHGAEISRRNFLEAPVAGVGGLILLNAIERAKSRLDATVEFEDGRKVNIPAFVFEKPKSERAGRLPSDIVQVIDKAWKELNNNEKYTAKIDQDPPGPDGRIHIKSEVYLAVLDLSGRETGTHFVTVDTHGQSQTTGYKVKAGPDLGVGTNYEVTGRGKNVLLADRQVIADSGKLKQVIYTPYSPDLDAPRLRVEGFKYLAHLIDHAQNELNKQGVKSLVDPEKPVAAEVPRDLAMMLAIIEQTDPNIFKARSARLAREYGIEPAEAEVHVMKDMANQALTTFGANKGWARSFSVSNKGARGPFQLMPAPYKRLREELQPNAKLEADFRTGASKHPVAVKAALLLIDSNLKDAPEVEKSRIENEPRELGLYSAGTYNAGSRTVGLVIKNFPKEWKECAPDESQIYMKEYRALKLLLEGKIKPLPEKPKKPRDYTIKDRNRHVPRGLDEIPPTLKGSTESMARQHDYARIHDLEYVKDREALNRLTHFERRMLTPDELKEQPKLVPLPQNEWLRIDPTLPEWRRFCTPVAAKFLLDLAKASHDANPFFEPIFVTSAVRPEDVQQMLRERDATGRQKNVNAAVKSAHPTGAVVDFALNAVYKPLHDWDEQRNIIIDEDTLKPKEFGVAKVYNGMSQTQLEWTEQYLIALEQHQENGQPKPLGEFTEEVYTVSFHGMPFDE